MKLHEITQHIYDWPETIDQVLLEINKHKLKNYTINDDLSVNIDGDVVLDWDNLYKTNFMFKKDHHDDADTATHFPVRFGKVSGNFTCGWPKVSTLEGAPTYIEGLFAITGMHSITSLVEVAEFVPEIHGDFWCAWRNIKEGGLGLLFIKGLKSLGALGSGNTHPFQIINRYIDRGEGNLIECQSELIEAGYEEYAQL